MVNRNHGWYRSRGIDLVLPSFVRALGPSVHLRRTGGPWTELAGSALGYPIVRALLRAREGVVVCVIDLAFMSNEAVPCACVAGNSVVTLPGSLVVGREHSIAVATAEGWELSHRMTVESLTSWLGASVDSLAVRYLALVEQQFASAPDIWLASARQLVGSGGVWGHGAHRKLDTALNMLSSSRCEWHLYDRGNVVWFLAVLLGVAPICRTLFRSIPSDRLDTLQRLGELNRAAAAPAVNSLVSSAEWIALPGGPN